MNIENSKTLIIVREFRHPPKKIWKALTTPHLLQEWLMKSDFAPILNQKFNFTNERFQIDCKILEIKEFETLTYSWCALGLLSVVTWTLTETKNGTMLRLEQSGFREDQKQAFGGAKFGWNRNLDTLEAILDRFCD